MDYSKLFSQGRAKSPFELWTPEENELVHQIAQERALARETAAEYVRNGVSSLEEFDKVAKKDFKPVSFEDAVKKTYNDLKKSTKKVAKSKKK